MLTGEAGIVRRDTRRAGRAYTHSLPAFLASLLVRLFGCPHTNMGLPITLGGETYCACLDCGARRRFDTNSWSMRGPYHF